MPPGRSPQSLARASLWDSTTTNPAKRRLPPERDDEHNPRSPLYPTPDQQQSQSSSQARLARRPVTDRMVNGRLEMDTETDSVDASTSVSPTATRVAATAAASTPYVRRKRAIAACQFCRLRKTKCDNVRPVCGSCRHHQAKCVYTDGSEGDGLKIGIDEAANRHREVLERLDDIRNLLAHAAPSDSRSSAASDLGSQLSILSTLAGKSLDRESISVSAVETESVSDCQPSRSPPGYIRYTKCESILKWPVLSSVISNDNAAIDSFIFDDHVRGDQDERDEVPVYAKDSASPDSCGGGNVGPQPHKSTLPSPGVRNQAFIPLCQKFLALVSCRNPILDARDLLLYARSVAESGPGWDAKSCIVVSLLLSHQCLY